RAALTGILVGAGGRERGGLLEVGVLHNDDRVVAAELQHLPLVDRLGGDVFADGNAACERDEIDARVRQHFVGDLFRVAGDDREHLGRQTGLVQNIRQQQRGQRGFLGGLQHHPIVGGDRRRAFGG